MGAPTGSRCWEKQGEREREQLGEARGLPLSTGRSWCLGECLCSAFSNVKLSLFGLFLLWSQRTKSAPGSVHCSGCDFISVFEMKTEV